MAEGVLDDLVRGELPATSQPLSVPLTELQVGRPLFLALYDYFLAKGGVYKLAFGAHTACAGAHARACERRRRRRRN